MRSRIAPIRAAEADAILDELEALATKPGPILSAVVELNRRWEALKLADDPLRLARCDVGPPGAAGALRSRA